MLSYGFVYAVQFSIVDVVLVLMLLLSLLFTARVPASLPQQQHVTGLTCGRGDKDRVSHYSLLHYYSQPALSAYLYPYVMLLKCTCAINLALV
jgi:hypothetical protein